MGASGIEVWADAVEQVHDARRRAAQAAERNRRTAARLERWMAEVADGGRRRRLMVHLASGSERVVLPVPLHLRGRDPRWLLEVVAKSDVLREATVAMQERA
jgi:hypothetical protein